MNTESNFSNWLRVRRNALGITQEELSDHLGLSYSTLRKLESGLRRPSGQIASILAAYFRIPENEHEAFIAFARTGGSAPSIATPGETAPVDASIHSPWRSAYAHLANLPALLTPLIGREQEVETACNLLLNPKIRLLTITGTAGSGKTRLALHLASNLVEHFQDGVYFVDLSLILDPDAVLRAVAHALELKVESEPLVDSLETALLEYVRERRMLFVLDNFEQVLDAATSVVKLMEAGPWVKVLVTSREPLHVRGERRFVLPPLQVPDLRQLPSLSLLASYPSIELFLDRAQDVAPDFELVQENAADIAAVCVGLDGLPLAIELAASRANHFSPADMKSALGSQLKLLTGGARDLPVRHHTLRAAIEWSYNLLSQDEQHLFRHLGIFAGGFTADAIEAIYEKQTGSNFSVFDTLTSLTDKSLVRSRRETTGPGEIRFRLLEAIREYAIEQMNNDKQVQDITRRHAEYYLSMAERAEHHFTGPQYAGWGVKQLEWINTLEADLDNMRAALDWYEMQTGAETTKQSQRGQGQEADQQLFANLEKGLRLAGDLRRVWFGRGYNAEGLQRLRAFLEMVPTPVPAEQRNLRAAYGVALLVEGRLVSSQEDVTSARSRLEEALIIFTDLDNSRMAANTLLVLGALALAQSDYSTARTYYTQCLEAYRNLGNKWGVGAALDGLGNIALDQGDLDLARLFLEESLALYRDIDEYFGAASALRSLGLIAYYRKNYRAAYLLWEDSLQLRKEQGETGSVSYSLVLLGLAAAHLGDRAGSRSLLTEGLLLARQVRAVLPTFQGLVGFGVLEALQKNAERAAMLFGAADCLRRNTPIQLSPAQQAALDFELAIPQDQLPGDIWHNAWARGYNTTLEKTLATLLSNPNQNAN